ncbi:MAG: patatin-like phospholipase family protein [Natronomonas sp.]
MSDDQIDVAIACQGGGSHTAFTAGVLDTILTEFPEQYDLLGLSGTSGGAACATLAWYGLTTPEETPAELLSSFWKDLAANEPLHRAANTAIRVGIELQRAGVPLPDISPAYSPGAKWGEQEFRRTIESHIDFESIPDRLDGSEPALFLSAIDVLSGQFEIFREDDLSTDAIVASAAEPRIFDAVEIDDKYYWDGLFSKNPPIVDFMDAGDIPDPDEIWLIKINPTERDRVPRSPEGISDRRNELSGNLSMNAEIRFLQRINRWIEGGHLPERYTHTEIRRIPFQKGNRLSWRTKLDRDPAFIDRLYSDGTQRGQVFLDNLEG